MSKKVLNKEDFLTEAISFAHSLKPQKDGAKVVGLSGNLGSGKTTFVQKVAEFFGVKESVTSPTFVIEKVYELEGQPFNHLIHIDAYRLESSIEMLKLGWQELVDNPKNLILVEWPEKILDIMPKETINLKFHLVSEEERSIEVSN